MSVCEDCGGPMEEDEGRWHCVDDGCRIPPAVKPCEFCGTPTTAEAPFGFLCTKCCFAENH